MGAELIIAIVALGLAAISGGTSIFTVAYYKNKFSAMSEDRKTVDIETITTEEQFLPRALTNENKSATNYNQKENATVFHTTRHTPQLTTRVVKKQIVRIEENELEKLSSSSEGFKNGLPNKTAETLAGGASLVGGFLKPSGGITDVLSTAITAVGEAKRKSTHEKQPPKQESPGTTGSNSDEFAPSSEENSPRETAKPKKLIRPTSKDDSLIDEIHHEIFKPHYKDYISKKGHLKDRNPEKTEVYSKDDFLIDNEISGYELFTAKKMAKGQLAKGHITSKTTTDKSILDEPTLSQETYPTEGDEPLTAKREQDFITASDLLTRETSDYLVGKYRGHYEAKDKESSTMPGIAPDETPTPLPTPIMTYRLSKPKDLHQKDNPPTENKTNQTGTTDLSFDDIFSPFNTKITRKVITTESEEETTIIGDISPASSTIEGM